MSFSFNGSIGYITCFKFIRLKDTKNMRAFTKSALVTAATLALSVPMVASAGGDIAAGKAKAAMCAGCHGAAGKAIMPTYPNLAGQNKQYLVSALKAYKSKQRAGGQAAIMYGMTAGLSDADMENLAAYFSSLK
jgi:cytochrome c553